MLNYEKNCKKREYQEGYGDNYERYIRDITGYPRITYEREKELAQIIQRSDATPTNKDLAKREFILGNLRLVVSIANRVYKSCCNMPDANLSIMDLIQVGNQALARSIELYDANHKTRFNSYAFSSIERKMWKAVKATRLIRIPDKYFQYMHILDSLEKDKDNISDKSLTHEMKITKNTLSQIRLNRFSKVELDGLEEKDSEVSDDTQLLSEYIADTDLKKYVFEKIKELTPVQRTVLFYRFFSNKNTTLKEISQRLGITRQGVLTNLNTALKNIKTKVLRETSIRETRRAKLKKKSQKTTGKRRWVDQG